MENQENDTLVASWRLWTIGSGIQGIDGHAVQNETRQLVYVSRFGRMKQQPTIVYIQRRNQV